MERNMKIPAIALSLALSLAFNVSATDLPRKAVDIPVMLPDGKQAKPSDYKGKVVALMFFLTTCPHCQATIKTLNGIQKDLGPKGFQVLAGAMDDGSIPDFVKRFQPAFPVGHVDQLNASTYMQLSPTVRTFVPFLLFIDRSGNIQSQYTGGDPFLQDEANQEKSIRDEVAKYLTKTRAGRPVSHAKAPASL
jgi:thiol-disulfide isomerase/thioredoxin